MTALTTFNETKLALIRKTVAADCNDAEFDLFIENCRHRQLDPTRRQIYAFVFHKDNAKKRNMAIVVAIDGYRVIAARTGNYRPGKTEIVIDASLINPLTNPLGISHALVTVYQYSHGEWFDFTEPAYWDEYAPIKEIWKNDSPTGTYHLDPKKDNWRKMPRIMIAKCAEAKALRRAWPDDFSGTYAEGELDRAEIIDITPSESAERAEVERKLKMIGGKDAIMVLWEDGQPLARVPEGQFCDAALRWARDGDRTSTELRIWWDRNKQGRLEYCARHGAEYLAFQKEFEAMVASRMAAESIVTEAAE